MTSHRVELTDEPAGAAADAVTSMLRDYNQANNAIWWERLSDPANDSRPLNIFVFDEPGAVIGGLLGETCLSWLRVNIMAVREEHRGNGIGSRMLAAAEAEAVQRGCKYVFLDTMQYQAPEFYKRHGYEVAGMIGDWDSHGHAKYFMTKTLATPNASA